MTSRRALQTEYHAFVDGDVGVTHSRRSSAGSGSRRPKLLDGSAVDAERIQLVLAGRPTNAHWCVDGVAVKSDWCGAQSYLVDDLDALCAGLDPEVAARIREFASRSGVQALGEEGEHRVDGHL